MPLQLGGIALAGAAAATLIATGQGLVAMVLFPVVTTVLMIGGAVHVMKLANRDAQLRMATGDHPGYAGLPGGSGTVGAAVLTSRDERD